jgi:transposase
VDARRKLARVLWVVRVDEMTSGRKESLGRIKTLSSNFPEVSLFQTIPGMGILTAAQFSAYLQTPDRFATKSHLFGYGRLAVVDRSSAGTPIGRRRLSRRGLGVLKAATRRVFDSSLRKNKGKNAVAQYYFQLLARLNNHVHARLTTQRRILELVWTMWKRKEAFDPDRFLKNLQRV